ncbi:MAG TPA: DUF192 domain-containing protein [Candidatus Binatia bacterium]
MKLKGALSLAVFLAGGLLACHPASAPRVILVGAGNREIPVRVEIADTPERRIKGLQYREELAVDAGMLFIFSSEEVHTFWMKNTPLPLDMIFIDAGRKVVGIVESAVPFSTTSRSVGVPSQFVLEVNGGFARRHGVAVGARVRLQGVTVPDAGF